MTEYDSPTGEFKYLRPGTRLVDFSSFTNSQGRTEAAQEVLATAVQALKELKDLELDVITEEYLSSKPEVIDEFFGKFRPEGSLIFGIHLNDTRTESTFTVGIFARPDGNLVVHRDERDWVDSDGTIALVATIAAGVRMSPHSNISCLGRNRFEVLDLVCLGFRPDEYTSGMGYQGQFPQFVLKGATDYET